MEALHIAKAAEIVRRDMFEVDCIFEGSFTQNCQENAIPKSLKALVDMLLCGPSIIVKSSSNTDQASLTKCQLLMYNSIKNARNVTKKRTHVRHQKKREMPLPLYLGLKMYAQTRKRDIVDILFHVGICVSCDRVTEVLNDLANGVCTQYKMQQVICSVWELWTTSITIQPRPQLRIHFMGHVYLFFNFRVKMILEKREANPYLVNVLEEKGCSPSSRYVH